MVATTGAEYLVLKRSYQGMAPSGAGGAGPEPLEALQGGVGRAAGYAKESHGQ